MGMKSRGLGDSIYGRKVCIDARCVELRGSLEYKKRNR